jgi:hypothetical protein
MKLYKLKYNYNEKIKRTQMIWVRWNQPKVLLFQLLGLKEIESIPNKDTWNSNQIESQLLRFSLSLWLFGAWTRSLQTKFPKPNQNLKNKKDFIK